MAIPYCTITAGDGIHDLVGITETALQYTKVTFTPNFVTGTVFTFEDALYRPRPTTVTLNSTGQFTVDILGNDPELDLDTPLEYTVSFSNVKVEGFDTRIASWSFIAPDAGTTTGLDDIPRVVNSLALGSTRGPRGYRSRLLPITEGDDAGKYQWVDEHGTAFNDPVEREVIIPASIARDAADDVAEAAVDADLAAREITFTDEGDGEGYFSVGGVPVSGTLVPPGATWSGLAGKPAPTEVKTSSYTASPSDIVTCDATSGGFTVTLPEAPYDQAVIMVKKYDSTANAVTIQRSGSDVFNVAGGPSSLQLVTPDQAVTLQYDESTAVWVVTANGVSTTSFDDRYFVRDESGSISRLLDQNGAVSIGLEATASAVNYLRLVNSATGGALFLRATGTDANIAAAIRTKGTGHVYFTEGNNAVIGAFYPSTTPVNYVRFTAADTGSPVRIAGTGTDTNVGIRFDPKGSGILTVGASNPVGVKVPVPASATATGVPGQWAVDANYAYFCRAEDSWVRASAASW